MGWSHGTHWTDDLVERELRELVPSFDRMPTSQELWAIGRKDLQVQIARRGGFRFWANRLGLKLSGSPTHRGQVVEDFVQRLLVSKGFAVERMTTSAPFDMLVSCVVRIDVKSSVHHAYATPDGHVVRGFIFFTKKVPADCDLYVLCCIVNEQVRDIYFVPAAKAKVQTITITPKGKYTIFKDDVEQLRRLQEASDGRE